MPLIRINPRSSTGTATTFSISKAGENYALNISLAQAVNGDAAMTHADVFVDPVRAMLALQLNADGNGFKLSKPEKGRRKLRVPITPETFLRPTKVPVGVAADTLEEDGMTLYQLPDIYWGEKQ